MKARGEAARVGFGMVLALFLQLLRPIVWFLHVPAPSLFGPFFDSGLRSRFQPADRVIERSGVKPGMTVVN